MAKTKPKADDVIDDVPVAADAVPVGPPAVAFFDGPMQGRTEMPADAQALPGNEVLLRLPTVALIYTLLSDVGGVKTYRVARTEPRRG